MSRSSSAPTATAQTSSSQSNDLALLSKVAQSLAEIKSIGPVIELRDKAQALRAVLGRHRHSFEARNDLAEVTLRAERRAGEILAEMDKHPGARAGKTRLHDATALAEIGIEKTQSHRWQRIATLPKPKFESYITDTRAAHAELTTAGAIKLATREHRHARVKATLSAGESSAADERYQLTGNVDVIKCSALITDPPYGILDQSWEPDELEKFTREWAGRWSACGADVAAIFWSQRHMWDGRRWFDESLAGYTFQQLLVWHYPNNKSPQSRAGFKQTWEPIFFYRRDGSSRQVKVNAESWGEGLNDFDCHVAAVPQSNFNDAEQKVHPAQKPVSVMRWLIAATTLPGELVCDPFAGSGTTGIAAVQLGRRFYGIESNDEYLKLAKGRIASYATAA